MYKWNKYGLKITVKIEVPEKVFQTTDVNRNPITRLSSDNWIDQYAYLGSFGEAYCDLKDKQTYISLFEDLNWDLLWSC